MSVMQEVSKKEHVVRQLREMELEQMAKWIEMLPDSGWEKRFAANWPMLAKKCGIE
jgi:hypothetical protein